MRGGTDPAGPREWLLGRLGKTRGGWGEWRRVWGLRTRTGKIVGVIGGYQAGGDTDSISYSVYLNDGIRGLYQQAVALG